MSNYSIGWLAAEICGERHDTKAKGDHNYVGCFHYFQSSLDMKNQIARPPHVARARMIRAEDIRKIDSHGCVII